MNLATAIAALALITSLCALGTVRQAKPPVSACEYRLSQFVPAPVEMKGSLPLEDAEAWVNFDARVE